MREKNSGSGKRHANFRSPSLTAIASTNRIKAALAAVVALIAFAGIYLGWEWNRALIAENKVVVVENGATLRAFARDLQRRGILPDVRPFIWLGHLRGQARRLQAGEYEFKAGISMRELLNQVVAGDVIKYPLVLLEGWTFEQALRTIRELPKVEQTLKGLDAAEIMARLGRPGLHPEGWFYPDTYYYSVGTTDFMLLRRAHERLVRRLQREWDNRAPGLPFKNKAEALILASIVEKETGRRDERRMIAGVFINRLRKKMRLQSDPTVIYGMGKRFDGNLRLVDLRRNTPYNTYRRRGLPPTPIALPGGEAINAVMHPADTRALYFVSRGDGSHVFSETLREHNNAVNKYQRRRGARANKSKGGKP